MPALLFLSDGKPSYAAGASFTSTLPSHPAAMALPRVASETGNQQNCSQNCVAAFEGNPANTWTCINSVCSKI